VKATQEFISTITSKGQVTVPIEIRRALGLKPQDKVIFRVVQGKVEVEPLPMTLEEAYGSVPPLKTPEDFAAIRATVREERAARSTSKGKR
jgi:AbrB family looped-hinge helix DNA binding protein